MHLRNIDITLLAKRTWSKDALVAVLITQPLTTILASRVLRTKY